MNSASELETRLRAGADRLPVGEPPLDRIVRGGRRRLVRRRAGQGAGVAMAIALLAGLLVGLRGLGTSELRLSDGSTIRKPVILGTTRLPSDAFPVSSAYGRGSVWVVDSSGTGRLIRLDARTGRVSAVIALHGRNVSEIAIGGSSIYVSDIEQVIEVDARTNTVVRRIAMPVPKGIEPVPVEGLAVGFGSVWATYSQGPNNVVVRIDRSTRRVVAKIPLPNESGHVVIAGPTVWVAACTCNFQPPTLFRIDPAENGQTRTLITPGTYSQFGAFEQMALAGRILWAISGPADAGADMPLRSWLWKIDPATGDVLGPPADVGLGSAKVALAAGGVWVLHAAGASNASVLSLVDPGTGRIVGPGKGVGNLASGVVEGDGFLWVTSRIGVDPVVYRVRP